MRDKANLINNPRVKFRIDEIDHIENNKKRLINVAKPGKSRLVAKKKQTVIENLNR